MDAPPPATEDEIQAFVDGRLDEASRGRVTRHLAQTPEDARRVEDYLKQRQALREALRPIADEPVPPRLANAAEGQHRVTILPFPRRAKDGRTFGFARIPLAQAASIALVCLCAGGALGWRFAPASSPFDRSVRPLAEEAADSYRAYIPDRAHRVEVSASDMATLTAWMSSRLGKKVEAPGKIEGLTLLGGRVVPTSRGPAAMFMYTDEMGRASPAVLLVCPLSLHGSAPMVQGEEAKLASVTWSVNGVGYSLVGDMPAAKIRSMAEDARRAFGRDT